MRKEEMLVSKEELTMANQIECPVCGIIIEVNDDSGLKIECPNCHEMVTNNYAREKIEAKRSATTRQSKKTKTKMTKSQPSSDYTVIGDGDYKNHSTGNDGLAIDAVSVSKYDEDGVKKILIEALVEKDYVPSDIFQELKIEMVRKYYLPYQLFEGTYQVPWNAVYEWNECVHYVENGEKKVTFQKRYGESNGIANGKFSFLYLACNGDNIPPKLFEKAQKKSSVLEKVVSYSPDLQEDARNVLVMPNSSFKMNWKNKIAQEVLAKGKEDAEKQARSNEDGSIFKAIGTGASLQNYNYQLNYDLSVLQTIMIPYWHVDYMYQDKHYWFVMDGGGRFKELEAPENEEEIAIVEENEKKKTGCLLSSIVILLFASSIIVGWMCGSWLAFLVIAAIGLVVTILSLNRDMKVDELNKEVRNENKKHRQELAQGLLSDWSVSNKPQLCSNKTEDKEEIKPAESDDYLDSIV